MDTPVLPPGPGRNVDPIFIEINVINNFLCMENLKVRMGYVEEITR